MAMVTIPEDEGADGLPGARRWGRWAVLFLLLIVLALAGSYFNWSRRADRGLNALLDELRRDGQPVDPADLIGPPVDPEHDAVIELTAAARMIQPASELWKKVTSYPSDEPLGPGEQATIAEVVAANRPALEKIRAARAKRDADWKIRFQPPMISTLLPHLNEQRNLAELCRMAALHARINGDDGAAVEHLRDVIGIGRAVDRQPFYVGHLVAIGVHAMAANELGGMAPDMKVRARGGAGGGGATPEQVRATIAELLDEKSLEDGVRQAIRGERVGLLDTARLVADRKLDLNTLAGTTGARWPGAPPLPRPMVLTDARIMAKYMTDLFKAYDGATDFPTYAKNAPPLPAEIRGSPKLHMLAALMLPASDRFIMQQFRILTERRMTAVALALRLYAADHGGKYPDTLDALVPEYLPAVPKDPFAAAGKPLGYSTANDPAAPLVYSVGENGTDAGGSVVPKNPRRANTGRWETDDAVLQMRAKKLVKEAGEEEAETSGEQK